MRNNLRVRVCLIIDGVAHGVRSAGLAAAIMCTCGAGCIHLHNEANAKLAVDAQTTFNGMTQGESNVFTTMLKNRTSAEATFDEMYGELAKTRMQTSITAISVMTWNQLNERTQAFQTEMQTELTVVDQREAEIEELKKHSATDVKAKEALAQTLHEKLDSAVREENLWTAKHALLSKALGVLASGDLEKSDKSPVEVFNQWKDTGKAILGEKINVKAVEKDEVVTKEMTLKQALGGDEGSVEANLSKFSLDLFNPNSAPGLKVLLVSTAVDLADIESRHSRLEVDRLERRLNHETRYKTFLTKSTSELNGLVGYFKPNMAQWKATQVRDIIDSVADNEAELTSVYRRLLEYLVFVDLDRATFERLQLEPERIEHEYSIKLSALNAASREVLVQSGLSGLQTFHEGGLKLEQIGLFISGAQAVALGVIGARVN